MKRFILIIGILLPTLAGAVGIRESISRQQISSLISDCRNYEGAELVQLGRITTGALKGALRIASISDSEVRDILQLTKGIKSISVFDFDNCSDHHKDIIITRIDKILSGRELLMEAKDGRDRFTIYGVIDDEGGTVQDFIMYAPQDCALICLFGTIPVEKAIHIINND